MNLDKYAKAIVGAVVSAVGAYFLTVNAGGSQVAGIVGAIFSLAATGAVTWGVPNKVIDEATTALKAALLARSTQPTVLPTQPTVGNDQTVVMDAVK